MLIDANGRQNGVWNGIWHVPGFKSGPGGALCPCKRGSRFYVEESVGFFSSSRSKNPSGSSSVSSLVTFDILMTCRRSEKCRFWGKTMINNGGLVRDPGLAGKFQPGAG